MIALLRCEHWFQIGLTLAPGCLFGQLACHMGVGRASGTGGEKTAEGFTELPETRVWCCIGMEEGEYVTMMADDLDMRPRYGIALG